MDETRLRRCHGRLQRIDLECTISTFMPPWRHISRRYQRIRSCSRKVPPGRSYYALLRLLPAPRLRMVVRVPREAWHDLLQRAVLVGGTSRLLTAGLTTATLLQGILPAIHVGLADPLRPMPPLPTPSRRRTTSARSHRHSEPVEESLSASSRPNLRDPPLVRHHREECLPWRSRRDGAERTGGDARQGAVLVGERFLDTLGMTGEGDERRCFGLSGEARFLDKLGMAGGGRGPAGHPAVSRQKWATRPSPSLTATGRRPTARGDPAGVRNGWIKPGPSPSTMPSW